MTEGVLHAVVYHEEDGFIARCLEVEVTSDGDTADEAKANLEEALALYFEGNEGWETPTLDHAQVATVTPRVA
jgi:predicted RNase H-like HicB family nuclease